MKETVILFSCLALCSSASWAAVYKCTLPDGRSAYQSMPCPSSEKAFVRDDIQQRADKLPEPKPEILTESATNEDAEEKPKTWLEKRAEERAAKKAERKEDHDKRVSDASQRLEFEKLIFNREIAIGMTKAQVLEAWGSPTSSKIKTTDEGIIEELVFKRYIGSSYTGKDEAFLKDGLVKAFTMDDCDSRRCR